MKSWKMKIWQVTTVCPNKNRTVTVNNTQLHQVTTFTNNFWHRDTRIQFSNDYDEKFLNWLRTSCMVSITTVLVATWHTWTVDFWADFEQHIINRAINERQNDCGSKSMPKDSIRTCVAAFDTAKHFIIPIETLFV